MFHWFKKVIEAPAPRPPAEFHHPELGRLTGEDQIWTGQVRRHERDIRFAIAGSATAPDPHLLTRLPALLDDFPTLEASALDFLCTPDVPVSRGDFTFQCLTLYAMADVFTFEFDLAGDPGSIWRVEFHDGKPKYTGRDS